MDLTCTPHSSDRKQLFHPCCSPRLIDSTVINFTEKHKRNQRILKTIGIDSKRLLLNDVVVNDMTFMSYTSDFPFSGVTVTVHCFSIANVIGWHGT